MTMHDSHDPHDSRNPTNYAPQVQHFLQHPNPLIQSIAEGYTHGAFLMDNGDGVRWYDVLKRAVVPLSEDDGLHVARRLRREFKRFEYRKNAAFAQVLQGCRGQLEGSPARSGEWITDELGEIYLQLHRARLAHSFEVWQDGELAGGILGLSLGGAFIAESKFHRVTNASKVALIALAKHLQQLGFCLLDAQIQNPHLETLGVYEIDAEVYEERLHVALQKDVHYVL